MEKILPNKGKNLIIKAEGKNYERIPIRTHVIKEGDDIINVAAKYAGPYLKDNDILFISERVVAITQGRAFPIKDIHPGVSLNF